MGRGQVVRQRVLIPSFGGSNPSVPEIIFVKIVQIHEDNCLIEYVQLFFRFCSEKYNIENK